MLFAVYMDVLPDRLKASAIGCHLTGQFFGCVVYTDDVLLLSHAVGAMHNMLKTGEKFAIDFDIIFTANKSYWMVTFVPCEPLTLSSNELQQASQMKYVGVCFVSDTTLKCGVEHL